MNMRRIPFPFKIAFSSSMAVLMCYYLYNDNIYNENLYKLATRYRTDFDESFKGEQLIGGSTEKAKDEPLFPVAEAGGSTPAASQ